MKNIISQLREQKLIQCPDYVESQTQYLVITGSHAYGCHSDNSDYDVVGWCVPHKETIFPHLAGEIEGFGRQKKRFEQWQGQHILFNKKEYDFNIYNIVKYISLCMEGNPNMIDTLFVPHTCILHMSTIGNIIREARRDFLHKGCYHKFKGYAYSQIHKAQNNKRETSHRKEQVEKYGYDLKFASHCIRLALQCEQILQERDLDLLRNSEILKSIRRGEWALERVLDWFTEKEKYLARLYEESTIPYTPDETKIKELLLKCLEQHFGSFDNCVVQYDKYQYAIEEIKNILNKL